MDNPQNYIEQNRRLIQTMVIKSSLHATLLNEEIKLKYATVPVLENNPETWKYYLNLAGIRHSLNEPIKIVSFDTQDEIDFNSENLSNHIQTRKNYQIGTKNYYILLKKYPNEELMINGSLNPVDINKAIAAKDLEILYYDKTLVEPHEVSLITELQEFINRYDVRWNVKSFISSDELYPAAQYGIFILNLFQKLINIRLSKCHTAEAHSFHIKNYLASHYGLDLYMPYMNHQQQLFLYRNIRYIERNIGKVETFKTLVHELLENRGLVPLYEISVKQKHELDSDYRPNIHVRKKSITSIMNASEKDYFDIARFENYQRPLARYNDWYLDNFYEDIRHKLATDNTNTIRTKFLLSDIVDYSDAVPYTIQESLFKQWVSMANRGSYHTFVQFYNAINANTEYLLITDAFIYFLYLTKSFYGLPVTDIEPFLNSKQLKHTKPTVNELLALVPIEVKEDYRSIAITIIDKMPTIDYTISASVFNNLCKDIQEYATWQWILISNTHDIESRAYVQAMCDHTFEDENIILDTPFTTYQEFLIDKGLVNYDHGNPLKGVETILNIYLASTGYDVNRFNILKDVQEVLTTTLKLLSSYSIDIIKQINGSKIVPLNWAAIRLGNSQGSVDQYLAIPDVVDIVESHGSISNTTNYDLNKVGIHSIQGDCTTSTDYVVIKVQVDNPVFTTTSQCNSGIDTSSINDYNEYLSTMTREQISNIPVI